MAILGINNNQQRHFEISGDTIRFNADRWIGKGFPFDPKKIIYNLGPEGAPHLQMVGADNKNLFFESRNLKGSRSMVIGIYKKDTEGNITNDGIRWVSVGKLRGLYTTYIKPVLTGKSLQHIAKEEIRDRDLHLTHITGKNLVVINDLPLDPATKDAFLQRLMSIPQTWVDHATLENNNRTLRVHLTHPSNQRDMGHEDIPIDFLNLPKNIYQDPDDAKFHFKLYSCSEEIDVLARDDRGVVSRSRPKFVLEYHTYKESVMKDIIPENVVSKDFKATLVRVRSSILAKHLDNANGREVIDPAHPDKKKNIIEVLPFNHDAVTVPRQLHFDSNPEAIYGSKFRWGETDTMVSPQHLAVFHEDENKGWPTRDQKFFFGEKIRCRYAFPFGQVEGREVPWYVPYGAHSLQYEKSLTGSAIHTGSNSEMVGPWKEGIFEYDEVDSEIAKPTSLIHPRSITEDALGAKEKKQIFGLATKMVRYVLALGRCVDHFLQVWVQRRRWAAMIGEWLSFGMHYFIDEVIRSRLFGALSHVPGIGRIFEELRIESIYTTAQLHNWLNVGTWYLDTLCKYVFALIPALYVFFGFTPLPATATFIIFWTLKTVFGWLAYATQASKEEVNPKRTFFPFPRDIFLWNLSVPGIGNGMYHIEDEAVADFANTASSSGKHMPAYVKRHLAWIFTALPATTAIYGTQDLLFTAGVSHAAAFAASFAPLGLGAAGAYLAAKALNKLLPNPNTHSFWQSFAKFAIPGSMIGYASYLTISSLLALGVSDFAGLIMNIFWPGYMAAGNIYALSVFFREQKEMVANREIPAARQEKWRDLFKDAFLWDEFLKPYIWEKALKPALNKIGVLS